MHRLRAAPAIALLVLLGCTSADILRLDRAPRPETAPTSIQLLGQEPNRPYTVIAIISARSELAFGKAQDRLVREAAKLGGHAILFDAASLTRIGGDDSERKQLTGKVIVFTDSTHSN